MYVSVRFHLYLLTLHFYQINIKSEKYIFKSLTCLIVKNKHLSCSSCDLHVPHFLYYIITIVIGVNRSESFVLNNFYMLFIQTAYLRNSLQTNHIKNYLYRANLHLLSICLHTSSNSRHCISSSLSIVCAQAIHTIFIQEIKYKALVIFIDIFSV